MRALPGFRLLLGAVVATAILTAVGVGCSDDPPAGPALSCGQGTTQQGALCVAATTTADAGATPPPDAGGPVADGGTLQCGSGTVLRGTACELAPAAMIASARLTYLNVRYDLAKPVRLDNPLAIRFGVTSSSPDAARPVKTRVNVVFSFVEAAPADPAKPGICSSNGILVDLLGNGVEQQFTADIFPSSHDCAFVKSPTAAFLSVDFDPGLREAKTPTGIDYPPVLFSTANVAAADNQKCRKTGDANAANAQKGCAYSLSLAPVPTGAGGAPLVTVKLDKLTPDSSVAILGSGVKDPQIPAGKSEDEEPSILVNASLFLEGRDPYRRKLDPSSIPAEYRAAHPTVDEDLRFGLSAAEVDALDDLPGSAAIKYDIVPKSKVAPNAWLPLMINDPKNPDPDGLVSEIDLSELEPGTENGLTHGLYLKGTTLAAVRAGGAWAGEDEFTVRGCIIASFPQDNDDGELPDDTTPVGGDVPNGDCRTFQVVLVKVSAPTAGLAESFAQTWSRTIGDPARLSLTGQLSTNSSLDFTGARTDNQAFVDLKGNIGGEFASRLFNAYAKAAALTSTEKSYIDVGVDVFGTNIFGFQQTIPEPSFSTDLKFAKSIDFPALGYAFGPISVGITAGVGGEVGLKPELKVSAKAGGEPTVDELKDAVVSGVVTGTITPRASLSGNVKGGLTVPIIATATITAQVTVVEVTTPVVVTLRWGVTQGTAEAVTQMTVVGGVTWDLNITWLQASCDLFGSIGPCPFCLSKTINVFKYENTPETINLLNRSITVPVKLQ